MFAAASQPHDICVAATVTLRGERRKWSGWLDIEHLARVQNPLRIECRLQCAHGRDLGGTAGNVEMHLTLEADAVLGRNRTGKRPQRLVNQALDLVESRLMDRRIAGVHGD